MFEAFKDFLIVIVMLAVCIFGPLFGLVYVFDIYTCAAYETATNRPTKYTGLQCFVQEGGQWYSWAEYKNRFVANGNLAK